MIIKLGEVLGRGGYAIVHRALNPQDDRPLQMAIKMSRVSRRVQRPYLQHEACVMHLLRGHPAILRVLGYGHLQHFEYLTMELLGQSVEELVPQCGMAQETVARIAVHLISALEFIHRHGLIHRDIKPSNVLMSLEQPPTLRLIDFGLARPFRSGVPARHDPIEERRNIPGTMKWASLNAHLGYDASRRDDLESLAYSLLFLLRGNLPWQQYETRSCTLFGRMKQMREKKRRWPGTRLGEGFANAFGMLLDYSRSLGFDETPDYSMLKGEFESLSGNEENGGVIQIPPATADNVAPPPLIKPSTPPPVSRGQLIYVKFLPRLTIEGYTAQNMDPSHWDDESLLGPEWDTKIRPAVVLDYEEGRYWNVKVLPLKVRQSYWKPRKNEVRVYPQSCGGGGERWPWKHTFAYALPTTEKFVCLPDQPILSPGRWCLPISDCEILLQRLGGHLSLSSTSSNVKLRLRIADKTSNNMYALLSPLCDPGADGATIGVIEWDGTRGWLDELEKAARRRVSEGAGWKWSDSSHVATSSARDALGDGDAPSDSNSDPYMCEWTPLGGRDASITLGREVGWSVMSDFDDSVPRIEKVV